MLRSDFSRTFREVFSRPFYVIIALVSALSFYELNVLISGFSALSSFSSQNSFLSAIFFFIDLSLGFRHTIYISSFISLLLISALVGLFFSLILFKANMHGQVSSNTGALGSISVVLAILAPGCAACGLGLAALLGFGGAALAFLPYKGLEISIASIALLSFTIFKTSKDMQKCTTDVKKMKGGQINGRK